MVGLREYIGANPTLHQQDATTVVHSKISSFSMSSAEYEEDAEVQDEFYDAIAAESFSSDEESDEEDEKLDKKVSLNPHVNYYKVYDRFYNLILSS